MSVVHIRFEHGCAIDVAIEDFGDGKYAPNSTDVDVAVLHGSQNSF